MEVMEDAIDATKVKQGGFFALPVWGAYLWRGLSMEGLISGILRYLNIFKEMIFAVLLMTSYKCQ